MGWLQGWLILCGSVTLSRTQIYPSFCSAIPSELTSISAVGPHGHKMGARVPHITCEHYDIKEKKRDHFLPLFLCFIIKETFLQGLSFPHWHPIFYWVTQIQLNRSMAREWNFCVWCRPIEIHLFKDAWLLATWMKPGRNGRNTCWEGN